MQTTKIKQKLQLAGRWLLQKTLCVYHQTPQSLNWEDEQPRLMEARGYKPVVLVARRHYQEFVRTYPISSLTELKEVLKTEYPEPGVVHWFGPLEGEQRRVCTAVVNAELLSELKGMVWLVPETFAFKAAVETGPQVYQIDGAETVFLYSGNVLPVSQLQTPFCRDLGSFMLNNGIPEATEFVHLNVQQYRQQLFSALSDNPLLMLKLGSAFRATPSNLVFPFKSVLITAAATVLLYSAAIYGYYNGMIWHRQSQIAALGSDVDSLLAMQRELDRNSESLDALTLLRQDKAFTSTVWLAVLPVLQQNQELRLTALATESGRFVLRGEASQALAVLTALQNSPWVTKASFDAPVRRQNEVEAFVISIELNQSGSTHVAE